MEHTVAWLAGVWQRTLLTTTAGKRDDSTHVFWLQTTSGLYADLRIPADLAPNAVAHAPQSDGARTQLWRRLALQEGFSGAIELRGDTCEWHRELDFQPAGGPADVGTLRAGAGEGEMLEDGDGYQETWQRLTPPGAPTWAFRLEEARGAPGAARAGHARRGLLLGAGDLFFLALGRRGPPPAGGGTLAQRLEALLSGGGGGAQAQSPETVCRAEELLGLELSFGRRGGAGGAVVEASTLPARVGAVVMSPEATPARLAQLATQGQAVGFGHADSCEFLLEPVEQ